MSRPKPSVLLVLDGWGYREQTEHNAIAQANTPHWDRLWAQCPHTLLSASDEDVGLPDGQMGNSEVGHLNIGAGRVVWQDYTRITRTIADGQLGGNAVLCEQLDTLAASGKALHVLGLVSPGGVHSHEDHIAGLIDFAASRGVQHIYLHAFLDGRDTPPKSAAPSLEKLDSQLRTLGRGQIASIIGRYYAMDRDNRWDRIAQAYDLLTQGKSAFRAPSALEGLTQAYAREETDEFVKATAIEGLIPLADGDGVLFANFRADRARQLSYALTQKDFSGFSRQACPALGTFITLTQYDKDLSCAVAFPPQSHEQVLGEVLSEAGLTQLRIAETEKYAHVTFFFNGGVEAPFKGESRTLIPSPKVATYDLHPQMSVEKVADTMAQAIMAQSHDVIIANFANADMVGHTGDFKATCLAIEALDQAIGVLAQALEAVGGQMLITADHGNAECLYDQHTGQSHTAHTRCPVPLLYVGPANIQFASSGALSDIAPTLLALMQLPCPEQMTGKNLLTE